MIIAQLRGGLGNQMFQYAAGRRLAEKNKTKLKLDLRLLLDRTPREHFVYRNFDLDIFRIQENIAKSYEVKILSIGLKRALFKLLGKDVQNRRCIIEPHFHFYRELLDAPDNVYLDGHWQSYKYFADIEQIIRKEFVFKKGFDAISMKMAQKIRSMNSVCINVRRADFVHNPIARKQHGVCSLAYYKQAEKIIYSNVNNPHFFVFSDDIAWCVDNISFNHDFTIVSHDCAGRKFDDYLHLMTLCDHYILANSSFAWWAVWLNPKKGKVVIAPKKWFNNHTIDTTDLIPKNWIRI